MRESVYVLIAFVVILLSVPAAVAQDDQSSSEQDFSSPAFYIGLGGATGIDMAAEDELNSLLEELGYAGAKMDIKSAIGFNAKIGARAGPHVATEVQFEYLPEFDWKVPVGDTSITALQTSMLAVTANLKLFLLTGRIQPFALIGVGGTFAKLSSPILPGSQSFSGYALRGGGGVNVYLTEHIAVSADVSYLFPAGDTRHLDYLSIGWGLQYKF